jgi:hypothetical protein
MTWADYFNKVKAEKETALDHSMDGRLQVIQEAQRLFRKHQQFKLIEPTGRLKVGGLLKPAAKGAVDYRWFGSMRPVGQFWRAIKDNDDNLSLAAYNCVVEVRFRPYPPLRISQLDRVQHFFEREA